MLEAAYPASPRVLVVSHNAFGDTTNMGKTLRSYFRAFDPECIAQFYIHSENPNDRSVCSNYYRVTDREVLDSFLFRKKCGFVFAGGNVEQLSFRMEGTDAFEAAAYRHGSRRGPFAYVLRNALWKTGAWKTDALRRWIDDFAPEIVFFASGDYAFMYEVALYIADYANVPLVVSCVDDYYLYNKNQKSVIGRIDYRSFMKTVYETMRRASMVFTICDSMKDEYEKLFEKPTEVLYTSVEPLELELRPGANRVSYIGNLSLGRHESLVEMGRALKSIHHAGLPDAIDVYSSETDAKILDGLVSENGIRFHGRINADEVLEVMKDSMVVVHAESFDESMKKRTRFSISTKIAESLAYGPCLIAYGPEGIASIDYLTDSKSAYVMTSNGDLALGLEKILSDSARRDQLISNARTMANEHHVGKATSIVLMRCLMGVEGIKAGGSDE